MTYSTIYWATGHRAGHVITDGVQSQKICDATLNTARRIAREEGASVIVEDRGTEEVYRVTPAGHKWRAPAWWGSPAWENE